MPAADATPPRTVWGVTWRVLLAVAISGVVWGTLLGAHGTDLTTFPRVWLWVVDPVLGTAALVLVLVFVRRAPVVVGAAAGVLIVVSAAAVGPALLAIGSVSTRRRWREIAVVGAIDVVALLFVGALYPQAVDAFPWWSRALVFGLGLAVVVAVGIAMGQRRALLAGLRERAEQAEREQRARAEAARAAERTRIAHDMHDVLAHRISLVALHSSALAFRDGVPPDEERAALQTISENARLALGELRDVLGVLRQPGAAVAPEPPQPQLDDVPRLVDEVRASGMTVRFVAAVDGSPPSVIGQAAYRVVREALTNARKHATGAEVVVSIAGEAGEGLAVRVCNAAVRHPSSEPLPGAGLGLVAMRERVELAGGRMNHGATPDGGFELTAWLPWAT
ncbi:sensor histidine kinase [Microbacterium sp. NPDC058389]|uniref:sensor histidine kinase n=1 Tax=Microbacterium sp. NPDC058389 TaxID=3346475 RepID=UPI00366338B7